MPLLFLKEILLSKNFIFLFEFEVFVHVVIVFFHDQAGLEFYTGFNASPVDAGFGEAIFRDDTFVSASFIFMKADNSLFSF